MNARVPTFGIVAEGITDQVVIDNVLCGFFSADDDEPVRNYVQPPNDATSDAANPPPGGWSLVLRFFKEGRHREALQTNDYLVVQIDTDVSEQKGYDVPHREGGRVLTVPELVSRVVAKILHLAGAEFVGAYGHRLVFAVAVHGIECWLLPLLFKDNRASKIAGCLDAANDALRRADEPLLERGGHKYPDAYDDASRRYLKRRVLDNEGRKSPSLALFLDALATVAARRVAAAAVVEDPDRVDPVLSTVAAPTNGSDPVPPTPDVASKPDPDEPT